MSLQAMRAVLDAQIPDINSTRRLVLLELANYASPLGRGIRPSLSTIASRAVISRTTVRACLAWAEAANIIKCTKPGRGRGHVNVWAMNLDLLEHWKAMPAAEEDEDQVIFDPVPARAERSYHADKRVNHRPFYGQEKGQLTTQKGQLTHEKGQPLTPILLEPEKTLRAQGCAREARRASVRPEGRSPGSGKVRSSQEPSPFPVELDVRVNREAFEAWGALVAVIVAKREQEAARAWLSHRSGAVVERVGLISVASSWKRDRLMQALGSILDEVGWQVTVRGSG